MKLQGIRALVTGADSGIGQAIATLFAQEGADVAIVYHTDHDGAQETVRRIEALGRRACAIQGDVSDPQSVAAFFREATSALGGLEVLVNDAGVGAPGAAVADLEDAQIDTVLRTDLLGPLYCCRAFVRQPSHECVYVGPSDAPQIATFYTRRRHTRALPEESEEVGEDQPGVGFRIGTRLDVLGEAVGKGDLEAALPHLERRSVYWGQVLV
jgi:NAD(P)-dependent dehydrogenase (short-subunit alcohol dehydrogenase family)